MTQEDLKLNNSLCYRCSFWDMEMSGSSHGKLIPVHLCSSEGDYGPGDRVKQCPGFTEKDPKAGD